MTTNFVETSDIVSFLATVPDNVIDLTITSPPYDGLRNYDNQVMESEPVTHTLPIRGIATDLLRATVIGVTLET